jgi:enediyne biosynthesis protein E4
MRVILFLITICVFTRCHKKEETLFTKLSGNETGITFRNLLKEDNPEFNIVLYPYFYNGGGVAIGDINNDSLPDIFFTGNMVKNRLFLNEGDFEFQDITVPSKTAEKEGWCTGTTMVDINEDGWLDIYICRSGLSNVQYRRNLLFINNHDLTFTESAATYGLDDPGYSTQASFFDYDKDGDLDMFLINQSSPEYSLSKIEYIQKRNTRGDATLENKLFRNDNGHFTNVSEAAGIKSNILSFSLGLSTCDINQDGWPDIYVANDFKEADYFYINNKNGTFTESLQQQIGHTSLYAMGLDVADYNNDLLPDMLVLDMLAEGNYAQKMHMGGDNYNTYNFLFNNGMFYQYMKNSLQKNNGDGTFSEIAQLAGVSNTDWSWSPLFADYDNDGLKDLFISNGYKRDNTSIEFVIYSMNESIRLQKGGDVVNAAEYISHMPSIVLPNYMYKNSGTDKFENKIKAWGLDYNTLSNGAAYADLDNDGDLDLITNDIDDYAGVYRNNSEQLLKNNFLKIKLKGTRQNSFGIGTKIYAYKNKSKFYLEQNPVRGYQSSSDHVLHLGLGDVEELDSIRIIWPDDNTQRLVNVKANQQLNVSYENATNERLPGRVKNTLLEESPNGIQFTHRENEVNDFTRQFLLPHFYSHNGPCMAQADINGDGMADVFMGGAKDQAGAIFIQTKDHNFKSIKNAAIEADAPSEDVSALFFDADNDKDFDLYVVSGGYEFEEGSPLLQDRLYLNNGKGQFTKSKIALPLNYTNKSCVASSDVDRDGDLDLFVGGKVVPGKYPLSERSEIYVNDGKGKFTQHTDVNKNFNKLGVVNSAVWTDVNKDGIEDLIIAAEWKPLKVFINENGKLTDQSQKYFSSIGSGWWNTILAHDFDKDGDNDLVVGNYGFNSQMKVDSNHPMKLYVQDIDGNGSIDPIITHYIGEVAYPLFPRDDVNGQVPILKKKFSDYGIYAKATINEILSPEQLQKSAVSTITTLATVYLENTPNGFVKKNLPMEAQYAPVHAFTYMDVNKDGHDDLIIAGNNSYNRIYFGRHDANHGMVMVNDGKGNFTYIPQSQSGLNVKGDVRSLMVVNGKLVFGLNNGKIENYRLK